MSTLRQNLVPSLLIFVVLLLAGMAAPPSVRADGISFQISNPILSTSSDGTVTFTGTVTNTSGGDLNASDFFFNFFGFDANAVNPNQDLGVSLDFLIPNGTDSSLVALFDVTLGSVAPGSIFQLDVQLEDINSDLSETEKVTVTTFGTPPPQTPEPSTLFLLLCALAVMTCFSKRFRASNFNFSRH